MHRQILLSITIGFLIYFTHWLVLAYLPLLLKGYGLSDLQIGMAIGLFSLSSMALILPLGLFFDIFSPKRTMLCGALLYGGYFLSLVVSGRLRAHCFFFQGIQWGCPPV